MKTSRCFAFIAFGLPLLFACERHWAPEKRVSVSLTPEMKAALAARDATDTEAFLAEQFSVLELRCQLQASSDSTKLAKPANSESTYVWDLLKDYSTEKTFSLEAEIPEGRIQYDVLAKSPTLSQMASGQTRDDARIYFNRPAKVWIQLSFRGDLIASEFVSNFPDGQTANPEMNRDVVAKETLRCADKSAGVPLLSQITCRLEATRRTDPKTGVKRADLHI